MLRTCCGFARLASSVDSTRQMHCRILQHRVVSSDDHSIHDCLTRANSLWGWVLFVVQLQAAKAQVASPENIKCLSPKLKLGRVTIACIPTSNQNVP
eukprot:4918091-Amphidinium_carterae.2